MLFELFNKFIGLQYAWPWVFALLPLPLLVWLLPRSKRDASSVVVIPLPLQVGAGLDRNVAASGRMQRLLTLLLWVLLVIAAARPQFLGEPVRIKQSGRDLLLAVDASGSMGTADMRLAGRPVNRLQMVQTLAGDFIQRRDGDRLGLILFGTQAFLNAPLTFDRATVAGFLHESEIGLAGRQTAIGDAIALAVKHLRRYKESNRVLILLTDGSNTAGVVSPQDALELATAEHITIYTVGVGATEMTVNGLFGPRRVNPASDLDEAMLQHLAKATGGRYFRARDSGEMAQIYTLLDKLEPISRDEQVFRPVTEMYIWPLGLSVALAWLMLLGSVLPDWSLRFMTYRQWSKS